jgi:hypothetical protein
MVPPYVRVFVGIGLKTNGKLKIVIEQENTSYGFLEIMKWKQAL